MRLVDLTMPIAPHFRWHPEVTIKGDTSKGDLFQVTSLKTTCHGFTHVDAQRHYFAGAPTIEAISLERVVGWCQVFDLTGIANNAPIGPEQLSAADPGGAEHEIILLKTAWDRRQDYETAGFWTEAPWLTRPAAEWLLAKKPTALAVDFPQDYSIRLLLRGEIAPIEEHVTHDVLLRAGVTLIEYLVNTGALAGPRTFLCAAPLKIQGADGALARVFAIEGL
jgi:arylformamidase